MRQPTQADIQYLATHLRQSDINELAITSGLLPLQAIQLSVDKSDPQFLFAAFADDVLLCIGGCSTPSMLSDIGMPWLLATDAMKHHTKRLTRDAIIGVRMMLYKYSMLSNVVDARHRAAIRWLTAIGFTFKETIEIVPGYLAIRFEIRRNDTNHNEKRHACCRSVYVGDASDRLKSRSSL